jgi:hypothetical protein
MKANAANLICLKALLQTFADSTGLIVNYNKSSMIPINLSEERLIHFAETMQCKRGSLPFTYLGLPLSIVKPSMEHFLPIVQRAQSRLGGMADFLNYGGKLQLVKSVLASMPVFFMCCFDVPVTIKEQVVKYMRHCLWRKKKNEVQANGSALVAWKKICRPKEQGGLGVLNLDIQNKALMLKNLHKFFNNLDIPWVHLVRESYYSSGNLPTNNMGASFWWRAHIKLLDLYKAMARCNIGNGKTASFWTDLWEENCMHQKFPHLVSFAKHTDWSVHRVIHTEYLEDLFHLPLTQQAFEEFQDLEVVCQNTLTVIQEGNSDNWSYIWGNAEFSSKKAYQAMIGSSPAPKIFSILWKSSCQAKHKFFFWLLLHDRLNTRNLLRRKNFVLQSYQCVLQSCSEEETLVHLFWVCPFAKNCWDFICPQRDRGLSILEALEDMRFKMKLPFAMEVLILSAWGIWIVRNNKIFKDQNTEFNNWKAIFFQELRLLVHRMKKKHVNSFKEWIQSLS